VGKYVWTSFQKTDRMLVVNFKLTGRFQLGSPEAKKAGPVHVEMRFAGVELELRYVDLKRMGQLYLTDDLSLIPTYSDMGPDALEIPWDTFRRRIRGFRGEIKGILTRERFVAGIGNAYADEILWKAQIHPFRKRPTLTSDELKRLYKAMRFVLLNSIEKVRQDMGEEIHLKPREFFAVHMRDGQACPRCDAKVSTVSANKRITNFCRSCQPGGLIRGM
jgi:formamidopyrimidine-DNA glycosylase